MIILAAPTKPFEYTAKGTPRRNACLKTYEGEIEALYTGMWKDVKGLAEREYLDRV